MTHAGDIHPSARESSDDRVGEVFGDDQDEPDAHVEDAVHLGLFDGAKLLEPGEDRGDWPRSAVKPDSTAVGKDARGVIDQSAAGDMGDAVDDAFNAVVVVDRLDGPDVDPRGGQELVGDGLAQGIDVGVRGEAGVVEDDLTARL